MKLQRVYQQIPMNPIFVITMFSLLINLLLFITEIFVIASYVLHIYIYIYIYIYALNFCNTTVSVITETCIGVAAMVCNHYLSGL